MTAKFTTRPGFIPLEDGKRFQLDGALVYERSDGFIVVIPAGFITDFASVPPLARFGAIVLAVSAIIAHWIPAFHLLQFAAWVVILIAERLEDSTTDLAATVHDYFYHYHGTICQTMPRVSADCELFRAMNAAGSPRNVMWKRILFFVNVRLFGWIPWKNEPGFSGKGKY